MIAHARIVSAKDATIQFADRAERIEGESRNEVRTAIKHAFVAEARKQSGPIDVVIFDGPATHNLRVEPNGRIQPREADSRPLYASSAAMPAAAGQKRGRHSALSATTPAPANAPRQASASSPSSASAASAAALADLQKRLAAAEERPAADSTSSPAPLEAKHHAEGDVLKPTAPAKPHEPVVAPKRELPKDDNLPTLDDLRAGNDAHRKPVATRGFNKFIRQATFGLIKPGPGRAERLELDQIERIRKRLDAPKNIAVVNLKGGAHKTTSVLMLAATLGMFRGGSVLAWDNNETRGTLGWRGIPSEHHLTALDLLHNLDHFAGPDARVADLDKYVRPQGDMNFDILASDEDPGSAASIDGDAFNRLNDTLSRFYRIKVVDTGNNVRASNWLAAVEGADQLVIVSTVREDTFNAAAWMIDELRMTGHKKQVENAVTILSHSSRGKIDRVLRKRLLHHFGAHTRAVLEVPFEPHFVDGGSLEWAKLSKETREAWMSATATVADGL
ncbi:chromosome partitioning protein [Dermabacter vaginalis]|uniref:MinD/ParA family ATP-binding protein n=1 Tax=Dermabacter vaginalis TaxID=1630135 RepID=UPI0021A6A414|nr:chromosome partitioning protein [Dermabacter vaginalis]MCT2150011.1 chromosome partitioning protein [Dermabacter vaginalis]